MSLDPVLSAVLLGGTRERLRELLQIAGDEPSIEEALDRAGDLLSRPPPASKEQALEHLMRDPDVGLAALAQLHEAAISGRSRNVVLGIRGRPIELSVTPTEKGEDAIHA